MSPMITTPPSLFQSNKYDYLIIGGGTAGLVVASRLSEDPRILVGVIEVGSHQPDNESVNVPGRYGSLVGNKEGS